MNRKLFALMFVFALSAMAFATLATAHAQTPTGTPAASGAATSPTSMPGTVITSTGTITPTELMTNTILVGAGRETIALNAYFPGTFKVHVGDTVTWKINSDEIHTVSFSDGKVVPGQPPETFISDLRLGMPAGSVLPGPFMPVPGGAPTDMALTPLTNFATRAPGAPVETWDGTGFVSSGVMSDQPQGPPGTPPNNVFQLQFTKPGTYTYICLIHYGSMTGTVEVLPADSTDVTSAADATTQANTDIDKLNSWVKAAKTVAEQPVKEPGPNNTTIWKVRVGNVEGNTSDFRAQILQFGPSNLTIKAGDSVVWSSAYFHTVTFNPVPPPPDFVVPQPQPNGPPLLIANPKAVIPAKPSPIYDPKQYYNSGLLFPGSYAGMSWSLTFNTPGTYDYFCIVHFLQGMKATITVTK